MIDIGERKILREVLKTSGQYLRRKQNKQLDERQSVYIMIFKNMKRTWNQKIYLENINRGIAFKTTQMMKLKFLVWSETIKIPNIKTCWNKNFYK